MLGERLSHRLSVYPGIDSITLTTIGSDVSPVTGTPIPKEMKLEVTGVFNTGMYEYDNTYLFVSLDVAQELAGVQHDVTGLEVATKDRWIAADVGASLAKRSAIPIARRTGRRRTIRCSRRLVWRSSGCRSS